MKTVIAFAVLEMKSPTEIFDDEWRNSTGRIHEEHADFL
jgi:hypothetical protein